MEGNFEQALEYVDSAMSCLNAHYKKVCPGAAALYVIERRRGAGELSWWNDLFNSDFHVILDIRNEAAVAFLR